MTTDESEISKAARDAFTHGMGMMRDGKHVPVEDVYMTAKEAAAEDLVKRLRSKLVKVQGSTATTKNDWSSYVIDPVCAAAADFIEQLISDNKKLRSGGAARLARSVCTFLLEKEMFDVQGGPSQEAWRELNAAYAALGEKKDG
jgi:hypothetical protein